MGLQNNSFFKAVAIWSFTIFAATSKNVWTFMLSKFGFFIKEVRFQRSEDRSNLFLISN
ncbi:hypothetical protein SAMN06265219_101196 [Gracilimonas mengyeensis]|uniref:Uncharacterized protein n=1 Tax=Gracilimonas mengyeensis TaxID=1302730 RepID=A0A521AJU3_9BACT|nr:hypothetical protein SAMN06265219_101196 [Gracilimonas mengyeensis]